MKPAALILALALSGCGDIYNVRPDETKTITRVFSTVEETAAFCKAVQSPNAPCAVWTGNRGVIFLPYNYSSHVAGHEMEHVFSGQFHK